MLICLIFVCFLIPIHGQECGNEEFYCEKSDPPICIRLDQVCDGVPDCQYEEYTFEYEYEANYTALGTIQTFLIQDSNFFFIKTPNRINSQTHALTVVFIGESAKL